MQNPFLVLMRVTAMQDFHFNPAYNNNNEAFFCGFRFNSKHCNIQKTKKLKYGEAN